MWRPPDWACVPSLCGHVSRVWWQCRSTEIRRQDICQHSSEEQVKSLALLGSHFHTQKTSRQSRETLQDRRGSAPVALYSPAGRAGRSERTPGFCLRPCIPPGSKEGARAQSHASPDALAVSLSGQYSSRQPWVAHPRLHSPWETQMWATADVLEPGVSDDTIVIIDKLRDVLENQPVQLLKRKKWSRSQN